MASKEERDKQVQAPAGMYMSSVKVGPKGQIVIPKEARAMFDIKPGDILLLLADVNRGIAIHRYEVFKQVMDAAMGGRGQAEQDREAAE